MNEYKYISKDMILDVIKARGRYLGDAEIMNSMDKTALNQIEGYKRALDSIAEDVENIPPVNVQPVKKCRMIPHNPDCRGYTDVFICTNCQLHIHLGFISKNYGGNFCLECGAEVEDGDSE